MIQEKLVRDKIPELIRLSGEQPIIRFLSREEYTARLEAKLDEEVQEYHRDKNMEELADILEVVYALCEDLGYTRDQLEAVYRRKHDARGGFRDRILLLGKTESSTL